MKKKLLLIAAAIVSCVTICNAQDYEVLYVEQLVSDSVYKFCQPQVPGVIIYGQENCESNQFYVDGQLFETDSIILYGGNCWVGFNGCDYFYVGFWVEFTSSDFFYPFPSSVIWKRVGQSITIGNEWTNWTWQWSTGESSPIIDVIIPGIYSVIVSDFCGSEAYSVEVCDNVEIYRAGIDLATGYNKLVWHVNPVMLSVYDQVKVIWKGSQVAGYAPYASGEFIHEGQGSDIQSWNYRLVGITYDGTECPIESYMIGTPHANFYPINNNTKLKIDWTSPFIEEGAPLSIDHIEVYKYQPSSQEIVVVSDYVEPNAEEVSFPIESFNNGQAVLGFVFNDGRDGEEISYTNLSEYFDIDGVAENGESAFEVYPNPSNGTFTVEGAVSLTITNIMGQVVAKSYAENGMHTISLSSAGAGVYFISDGILSKKVIIK